jgi:hypothetical protein
LRDENFVLGVLAFSAAGVIGCKERVRVLKVPENADECADLFHFFTDPAFGLEQARSGLGIASEPRVLDDPGTRKLFTYEYESGLLKSIGFQTGPDDHPDAGKLDAIYIKLPKPDRCIPQGGLSAISVGRANTSTRSRLNLPSRCLQICDRAKKNANDLPTASIPINLLLQATSKAISCSNATPSPRTQNAPIVCDISDG